jgi:hypothetical protein
MKENRNLLSKLVACGIALAMVSTLTAQTLTQRTAKVVRIKGYAKYITGANTGKYLKVGDVVKSGTVIQTARESSVDFLLGEGSTPVSQPGADGPPSYNPTAKQNMVRMWENTLLGIDALTEKQTGADVVTDTQLDLKAGRITGSVRKMSAASTYEIKIPVGVAGVRGTLFDISADGVIKVLEGSMVLAYVGPGGSPKTQVVNALYQFDARTETLTPMTELDRKGLEKWFRDVNVISTVGARAYSHDSTYQYVSPH